MPDPISFDLDPNTGVLTDVLRSFTAILTAGGKNIVDYQKDALATFAAFQIVKAFVEFGVSRRNTLNAVATILGGVAWYQIGMNIVELANGWIEWMGGLGTFLSGGVIQSGNVMKDPSGILKVGFKASKDLIDVSNGLDFLTQTVVVGMIILTTFMIVIGFIAMGIVAVYVVVEALIKVVVAITLIPFAVEPSTRMLAAPAIGMIMDAGISMGGTAIVLGIGQNYFARLTPPEGTITLRYGMDLVAAAFLISTLSGGAALLGKAASMAVGGALLAKRFG